MAASYASNALYPQKRTLAAWLVASFYSVQHMGSSDALPCLCLHAELGKRLLGAASIPVGALKGTDWAAAPPPIHTC